MARKTVYEGPDLQQLLQEVIDEHGPARIRPPERRRKGGLFGFFAREVYVITVDDADPASAPDNARAEVQSPAVPPNVASPGDADDAVAKQADVTAPGDGKGVAVSASVGAGSGAGRTRAADGTFAGASNLTSHDHSVPTPLRALVESTEDEAELSSSPSRDRAVGGADRTAVAHTNSSLRSLVGTSPRDGAARVQGPAPAVHKPFRDVLSEVASSLGEEPGTYRPDPGQLRRPARAAVVRPSAALSAPRDLGGATGTDAQAAARCSRPLRREDLPSVPAQLSLVESSEVIALSTEVTTPSPEGATAADGMGAAVATARAAEPRPEHEPPGDSHVPPGDSHVPPGDSHVPPVDLHEPHEGAPDLDAAIVDLLRAAGYPDDLLPSTSLDPDLPILEAVFASLSPPPPLPADPGGLVAVVGSAGLVRPLANAVALAVGCPEDEVAVASPSASDRHARAECRARSAAQASALHPGWRRDKVAVVAVYAPPMGSTQCWTREVLHALRPSCVWGMAGATTKPDDVRRWVGAIGGVDALAVTEVDATATPASILSLGIPVACLDEEPATPERWASTVAELVTRH